MDVQAQVVVSGQAPSHPLFVPTLISHPGPLSPSYTMQIPPGDKISRISLDELLALLSNFTTDDDDESVAEREAVASELGGGCELPFRLVQR